MWQRTEHQVGSAKCNFVGADECNLMHATPGAYAHGGAPLLVGSGEGKFEMRMPEHQGAEFASGVAAGAKDTDLNIMHSECIILHSGAVNRREPA